MRWNACIFAVVLVAVCAGSVAFAGGDLFEEAGHALGHSRWLNIRLLPSIDIALEADDVVLVRSIDHPAKSFAIKIDGKASATDCEVTETKDTDFTVAKTSKSGWGLGSTSTSTTYWARCQLEEGTTARAVQAKQITVQVAMTNGTTKPHPLKPKGLAKFKTLDK